MSEQMPEGPDEGHPILTGLAALVGVAVVVGLILGLVVVAGAHVAGLGGGDQTGSSTAEASMYLPRPQKTPMESGPQITLAPGASTPSSAPSGQQPKHHKKKPSKSKELTLSAGVTSASPMQQIDLTGIYPSGEGAILQVQRFADGGWQDFPVTVSVSNQTFATYVQTSQGGVNRFRVVDTDTHLASNEVRVTIR